MDDGMPRLACLLLSRTLSDLFIHVVCFLVRPWSWCRYYWAAACHVAQAAQAAQAGQASGGAGDVQPTLGQESHATSCWANRPDPHANTTRTQRTQRRTDRPRACQQRPGTAPLCILCNAPRRIWHPTHPHPFFGSLCLVCAPGVSLLIGLGGPAAHCACMSPHTHTHTHT